jgi:hypothetical protein
MNNFIQNNWCIQNFGWKSSKEDLSKGRHIISQHISGNI